ncbi:capsular polysaccharide synthesis protein [Leuconostoc mesenteroides]|uniref:capsular polysaccharide synthesis protein n=1 Tax=Leuconostoc mesenteroides TaxID=1245 RepID=UPI0007513B2C|nr:capsular polysaccharide synthesis protein [Leuconostoc mesenteroides]MCM6831991.1 capsular polysaccharide synthesis protein [Leuconostoc mesenteroides]WMS39186.1 capsular polysaccharide synthesis protein [Leuconostoc mesenteroides]
MIKKLKKFLELVKEYRVFGFKITFFQVISDIIKYLIYSNKVRGNNLSRVFFSKIISRKDKHVQRWIADNFTALLYQVSETEKKIKPVQKVIWTMWLQGQDQMPEIVKLCNESVEKNKGNYQHIILNNDNLHKYVDIPDYIFHKWKNGVISNAHFSDYIRVYILDMYGGIWLDATVLLNHPFSNNIANGCSQYHAKGISSFNNDFLYYESHNWESYFLARFNKTNMYLFLKEALEIYWKKYNKEVDYLFLNHLAFLARNNTEILRVEYQNIPFNNPEIENMYSLLSKSTSSMDFQRIMSDGTTTMFKLNHRHDFYDLNEKKETVYAYFKRKYN